MTTEPETIAPAPAVSPPDGTPVQALQAARARRWMAGFGLPISGSVIVHALILIAAAAVVWRVAVGSSAPKPPEVFIAFEEPGTPTPPVPPREATKITTGSTAPAAALRAPASEAAPSLTGLSIDTTTPAPRLEGGHTDAGTSPDPAAALRSTAPSLADVRFAGLGASSARSVVYVIDGSGPMVSSLSNVLDEVQRSILRLSPSQRFGVIVFRRIEPPRPGDPAYDDPNRLRATDEADGPGYIWFTPALIRATPEAKLQVQKWLEEERKRPRGRSNPLDGLRAAIAMKPDAIFLLSRSIARSGGGVWELGLEKTMAELDRLNPLDRSDGRRPIVIKTIQFIDDDPTGILQAIAKLHGGKDSADKPAYRLMKSSAELIEK
ncbi:MAG: hypothetical protein KF745_15125 [Phycisphaeraceae bacterium]|nr:hypothetical protein [Phycisphaeraceae bacterium]